MKSPQTLIQSLGRKLIRAYDALGYPFLPLTRKLRRPLRWLYHRSPYLRHDSRFHWAPNLLLGLHTVLVREHPADFTIYGGQISFRSTGSVMSLHGYYVGEIERHLVDFVVGQLRPGFTMIDVGAHHGVFTLTAAHELRRRGWQGQIISFEPDPENFRLLERNVRENHLERYATLHQTAVANMVGEEELLRFEQDNSGNTLSSTGEFAIARDVSVMPIRVGVTSLDSLLETVSTVHFIKMDIQGAEPVALAGAERMIARDRPILAVEAVDTWPSAGEVRTFLLDHDYRIHGVTREGLLCPVDSDDAFVSWDWVAVPE